MIGCDCSVCHSTDPQDRRTRPSILLELGDSGADRSPFAAVVRSILVDTSTDLRAQALAHQVRRVDAILFTHSHADHIMGLDEVRRFNVLQRAAIACFADEQTLGDLRRSFAYVFSPQTAPGAAFRNSRHSGSRGHSRLAAWRLFRSRCCTAADRSSGSAWAILPT